MPSLEGIGLTTGTQVEIIAAYSASHREILAVDTTPGWYVVGAFQMSATAKVRLELIGSVSDTGLVLRARLFDVDLGEPVSGSTAQLSTDVDSRALSGVFSLTGPKLYQIQAEVTGDSGDAEFGVMKSASLVNGE